MKYLKSDSLIELRDSFDDRERENRADEGKGRRCSQTSGQLLNWQEKIGKQVSCSKGDRKIRSKAFHRSDRRNHIGKMSFPLHAHHVMVLATLTFVVAVTTPEWYISPANHLKMNIFQICAEKTGVQICEWTLSTHLNNKYFEKSQFCRFLLYDRSSWRPSLLVRMIYPIVTALLSIICVVTSLTCLFLGSWHIQRFARENKAKWLPILISIIVLLCCMSIRISEHDLVDIYRSFSLSPSSLLLRRVDHDVDRPDAADGVTHIKNLLVKPGFFLLDRR